MLKKRKSYPRWFQTIYSWFRSLKLSIATKLMWSFFLSIATISAIFMIVGTQLISDRLLSEAQEKVRNDLNTAREIYLANLRQISDVVRYTADRPFLRNSLQSCDVDNATLELQRVKSEAGLDILAVTDRNGRVILRAGNTSSLGDDQSHDELVAAVLEQRETLASTIIVKADDLKRESPGLVDNAYFSFIETPLARYREETEEKDGMMLKSATPIFDKDDEFIGVVYGGVLLNRNYDIVDKVKRTVYEDIIYKGQDIGTVTIFQDDLRISTNVRNEDGSRAIGTRVSEEVYDQVVSQGKRWVDRAYVVSKWYITAYEPIMNINNEIIGILYVGLLEEKYIDNEKQMLATFTWITLVGGVAALMFSYFIAQRILDPINKLVAASREVAQGNLDVKVKVSSNDDELQSLANSFNMMNDALKRRNEQLLFATEKAIESEKLAQVGKLAAGVAHELNSPLQGIVTFSHLLIEDHVCDNPAHMSSLEKIFGQANRCREIVRGMLDFSRQQKPEKALYDINAILNSCISLLGNQAIFHNIKIEKKLQEDLPMAVIDASQIERVFINMIINAAEAMDGDGKLLLDTRFDEDEEMIQITFSDTGPGISEENIRNIFDPFFTTKDVGHGTGLGLSISYGIVQSHDGTISVKSRIGKGTIFVVSLPLAEKKPDGASEKNG